ncbi:MAG: hypothetical protein LAT63_16770 [Marinobacter sp.]|nr:hypothetical protein [Marinobacter sp.]
MSKKIEASDIELDCPHCSEINAVNFGNAITCAKCEKPLTGHRYRIKIFSLGVIPFLVGFAGYGYVDRNYLSESRYPLNVEYSMVNTSRPQ